MADFESCMLIINGEAVSGGSGGSSGAEVVHLSTYAEWEAIPDRMTDGKIYIIDDMEMFPNASQIEYNDTTVSNELDTISSNVTVLSGSIGTVIDSINYNNQGTITKVNTTSGTLDGTVCTKHGNVVNVAGRIHTASLPGTGAFFRIPEGFRPTELVRIMGSIDLYNKGTSVGFLPTMLSIGTDGLVNYGYSGSSDYTVKQVCFAGSYCIRYNVPKASTLSLGED